MGYHGFFFVFFSPSLHTEHISIDLNIVGK